MSTAEARPELPPTATVGLPWSDAFLLGFGPMDHIHREFVDCVNALHAAADAGLLHALDVFAAHARSHFAEEDGWMRDTDFPARDCHIDEHAAVLRSVIEVRELLLRGNTAECRRLAAELARWFPGHADYLDSALAQWMCQRRMGGTPVVLRRGLVRG